MSDGLDALALRADGQGASPGPEFVDGAAPGPQAVQESPNIGALIVLGTIFRELACMMLAVTTPKVTLADDKLDVAARAIAPALDKHGFNLADAMAGPELQAVMVAGPILWTAAQQLNLELKAKKAKPVEPAAASSSDGDGSS